MRKWIIFALAIVATRGLAQDLNRKITFAAPAGSARTVLAELTKVAGVVVRSGSLTHDEVILISVKDAPLAEVLKKIAEVTGAEWEIGSGIYTLIRSGTGKAQEAAYVAARAAAFKTSVATSLLELEKLPILDAAAIKAQEQQTKAGREQLESQIQGLASGGGPISFAVPRGGGTSPARRALLRLLGSLPLEALAAMGPSTRAVFATTPTRAQRTLPDAAKKVAKTFIEEHNLWVATVGKPVEPAGGGNGTFTIRAFGNGADLMNNDRPAEKISNISKTMIVATRFGSGDNLNLEFRAYDGEGKVAGRASLSLNGRIASSDAAIAGVGKVIELDEESKAFAKAFASDPGGVTRQTTSAAGDRVVRIAIVSGEAISSPNTVTVPLPDELRAKVLRPEIHDPLSFVAGPLLTGAATLANANLIAALPDDMLLPLCRKVVAGALQDGQFLSLAAKDLGMSVVSKDGWITVQPRFHWLMRENRVNRAALAKMLGSVAQNGLMDLDTLANYANSRNTPLSGPGLDDVYLGMINREAQSEYRFEAFANWRMLRLYSSLTREQRTILFNQTSLLLKALNKGQFDLLNAMIFNDTSGPQAQMRRGGEPGDPVMPMQFRNEDLLVGERTEALPLGALIGGEVRLDPNYRDGVVATAIGEGGSRFFTPDDYGSHLAFMQANTPGNGWSRTNYGTFRPARSSSLQFDFLLAPQINMQRMLKNVEALANSSAVAYDRLPADFRTRVKRAMESAQGASERGLAGPPPPGGSRIPPKSRN